MNVIKQGMNQESIQATNRALILEMIRRDKVCSRVNLARKSNLKQATLTNIVNDFIACGLVEETGFIYGNKGRRSIGISIKNDSYGVIGLRLTRIGCMLGVFNLSGEIVESEEYVFDKNSTPQIDISIMLKEIKELINKFSSRKILSIGIALPGPLNLEDGTILFMTEKEGWGTLNIKKQFQQELQLPIIVQHDACAGAWAQLWYNEKVSYEGVLLYMSVGQGVGSGLMIDGEAFKGGWGITGEIGHMSIDYEGITCSCGNRGCLEKYTSSIAFKTNVNTRLGKDYSLDEIKKLIMDNNPVAIEEYNRCCDYLGIGIVNIANFLTPTYIVLGDEMSKILPNVMESRVNEVVNNRITTASGKNFQIFVDDMNINSELSGAAVGAIKEIFNNYTQFMM